MQKSEFRKHDYIKKETICIYCGSSDNFCGAHILPESLGKFKGQPKQKNLICSACDREIGKAEEQLAKCGPEAIFRSHLNIKGKKKHKSTSAFERAHAGQGPIELKALYPDRGYEVFVEPLGDGENAQPLPQLVLIDSENNYYCIRMSNPMTVGIEYLKNEIKKSSLKGNLRVETVGMTNDEIDYVFGLLKKANMMDGEVYVPEHEKYPGKQYYPNIPIQGPLKVDARYFRAIAKIGFQYFLQYSEYFTGHEDCLKPVKEFIRYVKGKIEDFVIQQRGHLVSDIKYGLRPKYYGHFLIGEFRNNCATSFVQFFIGHDNDPPYYKVNLGKGCFQVILADTMFGHFYSYYPPEKRDQYTGEIQKLCAAIKIEVPKHYRVDGV